MTPDVANWAKKALEPYREAARFFNNLSEEEMASAVIEGGWMKVGIG